MWVISNTDILVELENQLLSDAFYYILENVIQYSPDRGSIDINSTQESNIWQVEIINQSKNIAEDQLNLIFDPFYNKDIWHHSNGLGINLALTRLIIQLHGGTINVYNQEKQGVKFVIQVPISI